MGLSLFFLGRKFLDNDFVGLRVYRITESGFYRTDIYKWLYFEATSAELVRIVGDEEIFEDFGE